MLMAALALVGITGMYLSQVRRNGLLGLVGYLVLGAGYLLITCMTYIAAFVLPHLVDDRSRLRRRRPHRRSTAAPPTATSACWPSRSRSRTSAFLAGGLVFGIALFRARVLARWATVLLAVEWRRSRSCWP